MSNYYTQASFTFADNLTPLELLWFNKEMMACPEDMSEDEVDEWASERGVDDPDSWPGFHAAYMAKDNNLWICHEEDIDISNAAAFVQYFLKTHRPKETVFIEWSGSSSRPVLQGFGGGVVYVTAQKQFFMSTSRYMDDFEDIQKSLQNLDKKLGAKHPARKDLKTLQKILG